MRFVMQLGFAIAGAAALWGWYFAFRARRSDTNSIEFLGLSQEMFALLIIGVTILLLGWSGVVMASPEITLAAEGISLPLLSTDINLIHRAQFVPLLAIIALACASFALLKNKIQNSHVLEWLYFLMLCALTSFAFTGLFIVPTDLAIFTGVHLLFSILTLGTIISIGFLFFILKSKSEVQRAFYRSLNSMSLIIWLGLGIEFIISFVIINQALVFSQHFYFMQLLIGLIILNGVFYVMPSVKRFAQAAQTKDLSLPSHSQQKIIIAATIGLSSWLTLIFLDLMETTTLSMYQLLILYTSVNIIILIILKMSMKGRFRSA